MKWAEGPCVGFDTETGGVDVHQDRIVTIALVEVRPGQRPKTTTWLLRQDIDIPAAATEIHGITTAYANEHGVDPAQALFEATGRIALAMTHRVPVVGYNISFDLTILEAENRRHHQPTLAERLHPKPIGPCIDTHVIDKFCDPYRKGGRKLHQVCDHYGVILAGAHSAGGDALAACRLFPRILAAHEQKLGRLSVGDLHQLQIGWRKTQMDGLRDYFDKQGTVHDGCDPGWPVQAAPVAVAS